MDILHISLTNDGFSLAKHLADEGNRVWYFCQSHAYDNVGKGLDNPIRVWDYHPYISRAAFIIFDMVGMGAGADRIRKTGRPVIGASEIADKIELHREIGQALMEDAGNANTYVDISPNKTFSNIRDGVAFLRGQKKPYVFKAMNNKDDIWTFVAEGSNEGLIEYMESLKQKSFPFLLQERVDGIEISTEGIFNGRSFIWPFNHTMEKKRLMNGNRGQNTGCAGSLVWTCEEDEIVKNALLPIEGLLAKHNYHGMVDVNCICTEDKLYFLEFTARFGYAAIENLWHLIDGDKTEFFFKIADGFLRYQDFLDDFSMAVCLSFPPYPDYNDKKRVQALDGMKVIDIRGHDDNVWLHDVRWNEKKEPVLAGAVGLVGCVVETGATIEDADKKVYRTIDDICLMKEVQYRTDISEGVGKNIKKLKDWGWLK